MIVTALSEGMTGTLFGNDVLFWGLVSCLTAQLFKVFVELVVLGRWNPAVLFESGGMPSSHSALVTGSSACIGWSCGFDSPLFAAVAMFSFIVMYDASGIRRNAGLIAERVNSLPADLWPEKDAPASPLKERLGHSRLEVLIGSLVGPLVALPGLVYLGSPVEIIARFN